MSGNMVFTVSEITNYLKSILQSDMLLSNVYIKGEISNLKLHTSGHIYFTLKDNESKLKCVMFKSSAYKLKFLPEDGLGVIVRGRMSIYERDGQYQLYAEDMTPEGMGALYKAYEQLKSRLQAEGLFDAAHKKRLPYLPQNIGIVTSPTGAAIRDIISIIKRRCPMANIYLYPVQVQGESASGEIVQGIRYFSSNPVAAGNSRVDVIITGRGGGSIEELWAFNEEAVARAIYECEVPVVSAVGHETDFTIADFVADVRAATPSAAAELVAPDKQGLYDRINQLNYKLNVSVSSLLNYNRNRVTSLAASSGFKQLEQKLLNYNQTLDTLNKYLNMGVSNIIKMNRNELCTYTEKLSILNPASILLRGYSYVEDKETGALVSSAGQVKPGDKLKINLKDGQLDAVVEKVERN